MKEISFVGIIGLIGGIISTAFGGWDSALTTLVFFMAVDYITGLILAGVFKKSKKSKNGALESGIGFKGLCRKGVTLLVVLVAVRLDMTVNTTFIKDTTVIAFITNELISIVENVGLMDFYIPPVIMRAIDVLKEKSEEKINDDTKQ